MPPSMPARHSHPPMCSTYPMPSAARVVQDLSAAGLSVKSAPSLEAKTLYPRQTGLFLIQDPVSQSLVLRTGVWGLLPPFLDSPSCRFSTHNARAEEAARKPSFRDARRRGQICLVPAQVFYEPRWETGRNVWTPFSRADRGLWLIAGLYNDWIDRETGVIHPSYTMLTVNADDHLILSRMHKPDPKLPADQQDKRGVATFEMSGVEEWFRTGPDLSLLSPPGVQVMEPVVIGDPMSLF